MKNWILTIILGSSLALMGCDTILQYPDGEGNDPTLIDISLSIEIDSGLEDEPSLIPAYREMLSGRYDLRYIAEIYRIGDSYSETSENLVERVVSTADSMPSDGIFRIDRTIKVHAGEYSLLLWVDFVLEGSSQDLHYDTKSLHGIRSKGSRGYDISKEAFSGKLCLDLTGYTDSSFAKVDLKAEAKRPFAIYQIIATDIDKLIPAYSEARYGLYFPMGYNAYYGVPDAYTPEVGYACKTSASEDGDEALIASDMVFIDDEDTFYYLDLDIFSGSGEIVNSVGGLRINLSRNRLTVIRGQFVTKEFENGGVGIDPGFDDEIVVPISRGACFRGWLP